MSIFSRRNSRAGKRTARKTSAAYRRLAAESLEDRALLAGDLLSFQNQLLHADVNADGDVRFDDALDLIAELRNGGARSLLSSGGGSGGEGEGGAGEDAPQGPAMFVDVNGDDYLSFSDVLSVMSDLRAEAEAGDVTVRLETVVNGVVSNTVGTGQKFTLNAYVQDNRTGLPVTGVALGNLDVSFETSRVSPVSQGVVRGPEFSFLFGPNTAAEATGLIDNADLFQLTGQSEQQSLSITGGAPGDNFTITFQGTSGPVATTGAIAYDADAATVQDAADAALEAALGANYFPGDIVVTGGTVETGLTFEYSGALNGIDFEPLTVDLSGFAAPGAATVTIMTLQDGGDTPNPPFGNQEVLYFSKTFTAGGTPDMSVDFVSGFDLGLGDDNLPGSWLYADQTSIPFADIAFGSTSIEIVELSDYEPVANDDFQYTTPEDMQLVIGTAGDRTGSVQAFDQTLGVLNNDTDDDEILNTGFTTQLRALLVGDGTTSAGGHVQLETNGTFTYDPPANFNGADTFQYIASDPGLQSAMPATVTINVTAEADDPTAEDDLYQSVPIGGPLSSATMGVDPLLANDGDGDDGATGGDVGMEQGIRIVSITTTSGTTAVTTNGQVVPLDHGTLTIVDRETGDFTYVPDTSPDFIGVEQFSYTIESFFTGTGMPVPMENNATANVKMEVGLDPHTISGFVYQDMNDNGVREVGEMGIGGVVVELTGIDFAGTPVPAGTTAVTDSSGRYMFEGVLPGNYTVRETQPTILRDGKDTPGVFGDTNTADNDIFTFTLPGGADAVDYNFGELGRQAQFISPSELLASSSDTPSLAGFSPTGQLQWYQLDPYAWPGITSLSITLNGNGTATLTAYDNATPTPNMFQTTVSVYGDARFQILAQNSGGLVVRLNGTFSDFFV
jgi:hypothetical protein